MSRYFERTEGVCGGLVPMVEIPLVCFNAYASQSDENVFDLEIGLSHEYMKNIEEISSEDAFIFDEETGSIALKSSYTYYNKVGSGSIAYKVIVPSEYNGYQVRKIGISAERYSTMYPKDKQFPDNWHGLGFNTWNLVEVVLPDTIEEIDDYAFLNCFLLEKINVPNSLRKVGKGAFSGCTNLQKFKVTENVEVRRGSI